jgi:hypothetical protein
MPKQQAQVFFMNNSIYAPAIVSGGAVVKGGAFY